MKVKQGTFFPRTMTKKLLTLFFALIFLFLSSCTDPGSNSSVTIHILDIGKADCIIITAFGKTVVIDTGEKENAPEILAYLKNLGTEKVHTLILSHFDKDHIGGAADVLAAFSAEQVIESTFSSDRSEYAEYHDVMESSGIQAMSLSETFYFSIGECRFTVYPPKETSYDRKEDNNASLIVTMEYGEKRLLFCGDAMEERIEEFLAENTGTFDTIKLPYHGNYLENYLEFLSETAPQSCIITCSQKNPADEKTLSLLSEQNIQCFLTDNGNIQITVSVDKIAIKQ